MSGQYMRAEYSLFSEEFVVIATENTEDAEMINENVLPLRPLRPFPLIAGLMAN
ncbi:MAG: hypothetical protein ACLFVO_13300 [Chloroflexaceae bacterium]